MIITGEKAYLKSYDPKLHNDAAMNNQISNSAKIQNDDSKSTKVKRKENKDANNDIYKNIKNKAIILIQDKREMQEKISLIQIQEQKVEDIEKKLMQIEKSYIQALENGKQEEFKEKVKIRVLENKVNKLNYEYGEEKVNLENDEKTLNVIKETLMKINVIKGQLAQYKSKLISLENDINKDKTRLETHMKEHIDSHEELIVNPLNFIDINQNSMNNILISITI